MGKRPRNNFHLCSAEAECWFLNTGRGFKKMPLANYEWWVLLHLTDHILSIFTPFVFVILGQTPLFFIILYYIIIIIVFEITEKEVG